MYGGNEMLKKYRIEIDNPTTEVLAALKAANIDFTLYEANVVRKSSESFACGSNFATTELILKPVIELDTTEYEEQALKNYTANLSRNLPYTMEKIVKL